MIGWLTKALTAMRHTGGTQLLAALLARTKFDYAKEVGTGIDASVVTAVVQWVQRAFLEAPLRVVAERDGKREEIDGHDLTQLIKRPNEFYSDDHLWAATLFSYLTAGNAYWLKVGNAAGRPVELWYVPHWLIEPRWPIDGTIFISHYKYTPGGTTRPERLEPEDVVHFRHGIDPRNPRLGLSPLHGATREIFMDLESSNFQAAMLRNMGIPGLMISPKGNVTATKEDADAVKKWFSETFGGDRRGTPLVMAAETNVTQYGFSPQQMDLSVTRNVAEERVCACLGIPAAVVGFGVGLQQTKVGATMNELRRLAWTNGVIPLHRAFADELERSLLPAFERQPERVSVEFDASEVAALQEDLDARATRLNTGVTGGWLTVGDARRGMGFDADDRHEIFLRGLATIEVPAGKGVAIPARKGNGQDGAVKTHVRDHTMTEEELARRRSQRANQAQSRYNAALRRMEAGLGDAFERRLGKFFEKLGSDVRRAAQPILDEAFKQVGEDSILAERIIEAAAVADQVPIFREVYEAHYLTVAEEVAKVSDVIGLATDLPDPVARAVVATGGRRAGLVDLEKQTRQIVFDALTEGRAAGEGADQLARRLRDVVPRGRFADSNVRARTIARTETKFAQNVSTIERGRFENVVQFIVFDNQTGFDDDICPQLDGVVVTADEAAQLAADEHANGTRSFSPMLEE